jgi:hypothetical protein
VAVGDPGTKAKSINAPEARNRKSRNRDKRLREVYRQTQPINPIGPPDYLAEVAGTR